MRFQVQPGAYGTLCARCENGLVYERASGDTRAFCNTLMHPVVVPLDIVRCTDFRDRSQPSEHELEKIAWELKHDRGGRVTGFVPPKKQEG